jgi:hypothetical protein
MKRLDIVKMLCYRVRMYFYMKSSATGQTLQLLEAYRPSGASSPRHRVLVSLGDLPVRREWYKPLANLISRRLQGELPLADGGLPPEALRLADEIILRVERRRQEAPPLLPSPAPVVFPPQTDIADSHLRADEPPVVAHTPGSQDVLANVIIAQVEHEHDTALGPILCGLRVWDLLGMPGLLRQLGFSESQSQAAAGHAPAPPRGDDGRHGFGAGGCTAGKRLRRLLLFSAVFS